MWFLICSSVNCLLADSLINGKFSESHQYVNNSHALDISTNTTNSNRLLLNKVESDQPLEAHKRVKRLHVFRPLFVYRQEKIERQRIIENRKFRNRNANNVNNEIHRKSTGPCNCKCNCCGRN